MKEKESLINKEFSVAVPHTKGGKIVWTCDKDNTIEVGGLQSNHTTRILL